MVLGNLIGGFIVILVGVNLIPTVADQVKSVTDANISNVSSSAQTLLDLTILFFAIAIMASAISVGIAALRQSGLV